MVTTEQWAIVHYATLVMTVLFAVGITGIYVRQVEEGMAGPSGRRDLEPGTDHHGDDGLRRGLHLTRDGGPDPKYVESLLGMVSGTGSQVDLRALPLLWSVSGVCFPLGCLVVGIPIMRARVLPRLAAELFAFGLPAAVVVVSLLPNDLHRLGAVPVGVGLAWLGYALWAERRPRASAMITVEASLPSSQSK